VVNATALFISLIVIMQIIIWAKLLSTTGRKYLKHKLNINNNIVIIDFHDNYIVRGRFYYLNLDGSFELPWKQFYLETFNGRWAYHNPLKYLRR
jgi:hypothetical protein